jgi:hypothetical protein
VFSPALHSLLVQAHVEDLHRETSAASLRAATRRHSRSGLRGVVTDASPSKHDSRSTYRFVRHYAEMRVSA